MSRTLLKYPTHGAIRCEFLAVCRGKKEGLTLRGVWDMHCWYIIGFVGQIAFFMRFLIQWIASETRGESYFPIYFWYWSLLGGVILFIYAIHIDDPVFMLGQGCGLIVYLRNLMLINKSRTKYAPTNAATHLQERMHAR